MNWRPGDLALVSASRHHPPKLLHLVGKTVELIRYMGAYEYNKVKVRGDDGWLIRFNDERYVASESVLIPLYDGDIKTTWSECVWKPKGIYVNTDA